MAIQIARRRKAKLRMGMAGVSGAGKTMSALLVAAQLGSKIGLIDSEKGSASLYVGERGVPEFSTDTDFEAIDNPTLNDYQLSIARFAAAGCDVLVVDSLSHSWTAALEAVDRAGGWIKAGKVVSPALARLMNTMLRYPGHVIATMRSKTEYAIEKDEKTGKATMKKLGLAPQVRGDTEYEFTVMLDLSREGGVTVSKSRCGDALPMDQIYDRADLPRLMQGVRAWLDKGDIAPKSDAIERIKFASDLDALTGDVATWLKDQKASGVLAGEDLREVHAAFVAKKSALMDEVVDV